MGDEEVTGESKITALLSSAPYDQWILIQSSGWCPPARYKHAAEVVQEKLYVVGGSRNGRYLSDFQVFDLRTFKWSTLSPKLDPKCSSLENITPEETFPASAGHSLVKWENKLLIVAGYSKEPLNTVTVWSIDLETCYYSVVTTNGKIPTARGGQSVTLVGSKLIMFGGEDRRRRLLNDLHILDLKTMTWDIVEAKEAYPAPRFDHIAAVHADHYLLIFGGSSHSTCFNDLHLLDLHSMEWSRPETQGTYVTPRGGHAGTIVDENWYIVGGGDNQSGATESIVLNTSKFVWSVVTSVKQRDPLASEGLTLCSTTVDGEKLLIAFGGYNGKYSNEVFVLKHKPIDSIRPRLLQSPAAAAAAASVTAAYSMITASDDKNKYAASIKSNVKGGQAERSTEVVSVDTHAISAEKKMLESRLVEVRDENSRVQASLDETNNSHTELLKELKSVQGQLAAESARCTKLEAQIAVVQNRLEALHSVEHELEVLRHQKSQMEREMTTDQRKRSGGVWQWMTSSAQNFEE